MFTFCYGIKAHRVGECFCSHTKPKVRHLLFSQYELCCSKTLHVVNYIYGEEMKTEYFLRVKGLSCLLFGMVLKHIE